ncbi:MAG: hypothetical protein M1833_004217 [Piccolia ochrophora]|nr:MAG: hypothetical protein M1833_004217 [Piccolia ochrophora]
MVLPLGLDTPRTDAENATFMSTALPDISIEPSFHSPSKDKNDLIQQIKSNGKGVSLKTPRSRAPFRDRRNNSTAARGEFTPLLKSVTKSNLARRHSRELGYTPSILGADGRSRHSSSSLPGESSGLYAGEHESSLAEDRNGTPMPHVSSSSGASTPLAMLPRRDGGGLLADANGMMTLKEQENIINKIEKENFGLKLKIHFLEEALRKAGPGYSEAALKENTDLKVDKVTMQTELRRYRKTLLGAERDLDTYRQQLAEAQESRKRSYADEELQEELAQLKRALEAKDTEIQELREQVENAEHDNAAQDGLKDEVADLEADLREKDRLIEERDDELEALKDKLERETSIAADLEDQLASSQERVQELEQRGSTAEEKAGDLQEVQDELAESRDKVEELEENVERLTAKVDEANEENRAALEEKDLAEANLDELRDEMANKSISTKGLSRQLEEKTAKLQDEVERLRDAAEELNQNLKVRSAEVNELQEKINVLERDKAKREADLNEDQESLQRQKDEAIEERESTSKKLHDVSDELRRVTDAKNLLQSRHDALTSESAGLQKDLSGARLEVAELQENLEAEQQHAIDVNHAASENRREEIDRMNGEIDDLRREVDDKERQLDDSEDRWAYQRQELEAERDRAEEKAAGLERTIGKLQESEGTLSSKEMKLQEALQSEKERHSREEEILSQQIEELHEDVETRRQSLDSVKAELSRAKEEVRINKRAQNNLEEKAQGLEDEVVILQNALDEELERAKGGQSTVFQESEDLKRQLTTAKVELARVEASLSEANDKVRKEKQGLQDQLATLNIEMYSLKRDGAELEAERDELRSQLKQEYTAERTIAKLRSKVTRLEKETRQAQNGHENESMAEERKELHEMLKEAKIEAEDLQAQILERDSRLHLGDSKDKELRSHLKRVREERTIQTQKASAAGTELERLQRKYDRSIDRLGQLQQSWDDERKSMMRRVRFPNTSVSSHGDSSEVERLEKVVQQKEQKHAAEIRGLVAQITVMQKTLEREEFFRDDLAYQKDYFLTQIELYNDFNRADLDILRQMGCVPDDLPRKKKRRNVRIVGYMIIATLRMQKKVAEWEPTRQLRKRVLKAVEEMRARRPANRALTQG